MQSGIPWSPYGLIGDTRRFLGDPVGLLMGLQDRFGGVFKTHVATQEFTWLLDPEAVEFAFWDTTAADKATDSYQLLVRGIGPNIVSVIDHAEWQRQRDKIQKAFRPERQVTMDAYMEEIVLCVHEMMDGWDRQRLEVVDLNREMSELALNIIARLVFGRDVSKEIRDLLPMSVQKIIRYMLAANFLGLRVAGWMFGPPMDKAKGKAAEAIRHMVTIAMSRSGDRRYMIDELLAMLAAGEINEEQFTGQFFTIFSAGNETTARALPYAGIKVAQMSEVVGQIRDEASNDPLTAAKLAKLVYTRQTRKEMLRLMVPAPLIGRHTLKPFVVGGIEVPAGTIVSTFVTALNLNPAIYTNPTRFWPERWDGFTPRLAGNMVFGGYRRCLGQPIAEAESDATIYEFFRRYDATPLRKGEPKQAMSTLAKVTSDTRVRLIRR